MASAFIRPADTGLVFDRDEDETLSLPTRRERGAAGEEAALPARARTNDILYAVTHHQVVVVIGETGSGKSTQIPQMLVEKNWGRVAVAEPNTLAAVALAKRVKHERAAGDVGYCIRFDHAAAAATNIVFYTCDMLLKEVAKDPLLTGYDVVVVDEAHTRTLHVDAVLGLLRKILKKRPALRLIIASATLDVAPVYAFFAGFKPRGVELTEPSRYPVDVFYTMAAVGDYIKAVVKTVLDLHRHKPLGDILAFVPNQDTVYLVVSMLHDRQCLGLDGMRMSIHSLHVGQGRAEQLEIALGAGTAKDRRVIVSTNVAETSVTIPHVAYVVDSGFVEERVHDADSGIERMVIVPISRSESTQRAGRCGRTRAGECYRLYTAHAHRTVLKPHPVPQALKAELSPLVLALKSIGVGDVTSFPLVTRPSAQRVQRSLEKLYSLGAIDAFCALTPHIGDFVGRFPGTPETAVFLLCTHAAGVGDAGAKVAAMLSVRTPFLKGRAHARSLEDIRKQYFVAEGDHLSLLNVFNAYAVEGVDDDEWAKDRGLSKGVMQRAVQLAKHYKKCVEVWWEKVRGAAPMSSVKNAAPGGGGGDRRGGVLDVMDVSGGDGSGPKHPWDPAKIEAALTGNRNRATAAGNGYSDADRDADALTLCMASAWFTNVAIRGANNAYTTVRMPKAPTPLYIPATSALYEKQPEWVLFTECAEVGDTTYIRNCVEIRNPLWLVTLAPHFYDYTRNPQHPKAHAGAARKRRRVAAEDAADRAKRAREAQAGEVDWLSADLFRPRT